MYQRTEENNSIRVQYAETRLEPVWDALVAILKEPSIVIPKLEEYTFKSANAERAREKIRLCDRQIEAITNQRARIVQVYVDGGLYEKEYKEQLNDCNSRILEYQNERAKYEQLIVKREERKDRDEILKKLYRRIKDRLENPSYDDRRYILRLFVERINLFHLDNYAEVFFRFPASTTVKTDEMTKVVSHPNDLRLVLHIKTLSEKQRRRDILNTNLNGLLDKRFTSENNPRKRKAPSAS